MNTLQTTLASLHPGAAIQHKNLAMFPPFAPDDSKPAYLTLDEALSTGKCKITEVSQGGSVPELAFENHGAEKILLLDGEELVGCSPGCRPCSPAKAA